MENHAANQEAFDKVVRHLLKQGEKSYRQLPGGNMDTSCAYRGAGDLRCAVGSLIPDSEYESRMDSEPTGIGRLMDRFNPPSLRGIDIGLLANLQKIHDGSPVASWRADLAHLALVYGLTMPDLEQQP